MVDERPESAPDAPKITVHILRGKASSRSREMKGPTLLLGAGPQCDIQMRSPDIAPRHCLISKTQQGAILRPLDPQFPVMVNGNPIREHLLADGDAIALGPFELSVNIEHPIQSSQAVPRLAPVPPTSQTMGRESSLRGDATAESADEPRPVVSADANAPVESPGEQAPALDEQWRELAQQQRSRRQDLERERLRILEQARGIESEKQDLERLRQALAEEKAHLRREAEEHARRDVAFAQKERELAEREQSLLHEGTRIQAQRLSATDETLALDQRRQRLAEQRQRLFRVRKKLFDQYRRRRASINDLTLDLEKRQRASDFEREEAQRQTDHCQRVSEELARRREDLREQQREQEQRSLEIGRIEQNLAIEKTRVEQAAENLTIQERALERYRTDLDERKRRVSEEERQLRAERERIELDAQAALARAAELQRRHEELEGKARTQEKQELALKEIARQLESQRIQLREQEQNLALQCAEQAQHAALRQVEEKRLADLSEALGIKEYALQGELALLASRQKDLDDRARQLANEKADHRRLERDIEEHARSLFERLAGERAELDERRTKIDADAQALGAERQRFEAARDRWTARNLELQERAVEIAQAESVLSKRNQQLDELADHYRARQADVDEQAADVARQKEIVAREQRDLEAFIAQSQAKAAELVAGNEQLQQSTRALRQRQAELVERERVWCEDLNKRRAEIEVMSNELDAKRGLLERHALAHRRHVQRLREVGAKVVERRRQVEELVHQLEANYPGIQQLLTGIPPEEHDALHERLETAAGDVDFAPASAIESPTHSRENDREFADRLRASAILDNSSIESFEREAQKANKPLGLYLLSVGALTPWQREELAAGRDHELRLGDAIVHDIVHRGVMATTYKVSLPRAEQPRALRLLNKKWRLDDAMRHSFRFEIEPWFAFRHPRVAPLVGLFEHDGRWGILSEFIEGVPLSTIPSGSVSVDGLASLLEQALDALAAMERGGLVPHGLRPSRLMIDSAGQLKLIGLGEPAWLAKLHRCERGKSITAYLAPEELAGHSSADIRTPLYSLGRVIQEALARGVTLAHQRDTDVARTLRQIIDRMTQPQPVDRCPSIDEVIAAIQAVLAASALTDRSSEWGLAVARSRAASAIRQAA